MQVFKHERYYYYYILLLLLLLGCNLDLLTVIIYEQFSFIQCVASLGACYQISGWGCDQCDYLDLIFVLYVVIVPSVCWSVSAQPEFLFFTLVPISADLSVPGRNTFVPVQAGCVPSDKLTSFLEYNFVCGRRVIKVESFPALF